MSFGLISIKVLVAKAIFQGVYFEEVKMGGKPIGYRATWNGVTLENPALWRLCREVWCHAIDESVQEDL